MWYCIIIFVFLGGIYQSTVCDIVSWYCYFFFGIIEYNSQGDHCPCTTLYCEKVHILSRTFDIISKHQLFFFLLASQFPGIIGTVDGTHERILAVSEHEPEYVNRKKPLQHQYPACLLCKKWNSRLSVNLAWSDIWCKNHSGKWIFPTIWMTHIACQVTSPCGHRIPCCKKNWLLTPFLNPANVPVSLKQVWKYVEVDKFYKFSTTHLFLCYCS